MKIVIDNAKSGANGIWTAAVNPNQLLKLAKPVRQGGVLNVVMIDRPMFDEDRHCIEFDLGAALLLNLGSGGEVVFIDSRAAETSNNHKCSDAVLPNKITEGDRLFLEELKTLPAAVAMLGNQLLATVRLDLPGELRFHSKSKKFVESPNNFWVAKVQPRDKSLRITVYGSPSTHRSYENVELVPDMPGYSAFKLFHERQLTDSVSIIKEAQRLKAGI